MDHPPGPPRAAAARNALGRATAALLRAEQVLLSGGVCEDATFDRLVRAYCRAAQALDAT
jgi:hypothetical protein